MWLTSFQSLGWRAVSVLYRFIASSPTIKIREGLETRLHINVVDHNNTIILAPVINQICI